MKAWPAWPDQTVCGAGIPFDPAAAFAGETVAERGTGEPETALRELLATTLDTGLPQRYWRLVALSENRAEFASGRLAQNVYWLVFERAAGGWAMVGQKGECRPRTVREGFTVSPWTLAPRDQTLSASSRAVSVEVTARCRSDQLPRPEFMQIGSRLALTTWIQISTPERGCQRKKLLPIEVVLPGRLGDRSLWDGSVYPPRHRAQATSRR